LHSKPGEQPAAPLSDACGTEDQQVVAETASSLEDISAVDAECSPSAKSKASSRENGQKGAAARAEWIALQKEAGVKKKYRRGLELTQQLAVVKHVAANKPEKHTNCIAEGDWWKEAAETMGFPVDQMKKAWSHRDSVEKKYAELVEKVKTATWRNKTAKKRHANRTTVRFRASGAGRKVDFPDEMKVLKVKIDKEETMYGHRLGPEDIVWMWREILSELAVWLWRKQVAAETEGKTGLEKKDSVFLAKCTKRLEAFGNAQGYYQCKEDLLKSIGRVKQNVARKTTLSRLEEEIRCRLTWQDYDWTLQMCSLDKEELKHHVCKPDEWMKNLDKLVQIYEDEIGVWVGLHNSQVTVPIEEQQQVRKRMKLHAKTEAGVKQIEELEKEAGGGMKQTRGAEGKSEDKKRITFLHRLKLRNVVQMSGKRLKPEGCLDRTVLVMPGKHANADYFSFDEGGYAVWNREWYYEFEGKPVKHMKGEKLGNMCLKLQQIKKAFPHLLQQFLVLQQPAAFRDGIIVGWCMEDLHNREKYVMMQHDLVGAQATAEVKQLRWAYMQPSACIAPEMTACTQLTDIMIAHVVKSIARKEMPRIRQWLKHRARKNGEEVKYTMGTLEILLIAEAIDKGLNEWLKTYDFVFHGARQGGHLAFLPDLQKQILITVEEAAKHWHDEEPELDEAVGDPLVKVPKLGGGKLDAAWLKDRYCWHDAKHKHVKPDWTEMDVAGPGCQLQEFSAEDDHCLEIPMETQDEDGKITAEEQDIFDEHYAALQNHPAIRHAQYTHMYEQLETVKAKKGSKKAALKKKDAKQKLGAKSAKIRRAKMNANFAWKLKAAQYLSEGYTAEDIAGRVLLKARPKAAPKQKSGQKKMKMYSGSGTICLKAAAAKVKDLKTKEKEEVKATAKLILELGPMVGKKVLLHKEAKIFSHLLTPPKLL
jgi:hypothetical protein